MRAFAVLPRSSLGFSVAATVLLLFSGPTAGGAQGSAGWSGSAGLGLAVDLDGGEQEVEGPGLATQAELTVHTRGGTGWGLQWNGAWLDGRYADERRALVALVVERRLGSSPLRLRLGPGLGLLTVVEVDFPEPGTVGDGLVSIGDQGAWGGVAGLSARLRLGARITVAPLATLVYQRAGGHGSGPGVDVLTLALGGRVGFGP